MSFLRTKRMSPSAGNTDLNAEGKTILPLSSVFAVYSPMNVIISNIGNRVSRFQAGLLHLTVRLVHGYSPPFPRKYSETFTIYSTFFQFFTLCVKNDFRSFIGSGSGHSSEVVLAIRRKWLRSFIGSGSGYSSEVAGCYRILTDILRKLLYSPYEAREPSWPVSWILKQLLNKQNDYGKCSFGCDKGSQKYQKVQGGTDYR